MPPRFVLFVPLLALSPGCASPSHRADAHGVTPTRAQVEDDGAPSDAEERRRRGIAWDALDVRNVPGKVLERPLETDAVRPGGESKPGEWILAPVPFFNQQLGWGLVLGAGYIFGTDAESPPSSGGVGLLVSDNGSSGAFAGVSPRFAADTWRLTLGAGSADVRYDFFGIGNDSGREGVEIPLASQGDFATFEALYEFWDDAYLGPRVTVSSVETDIRSEDDVLDLIGDELDVQDLQIGLRFLDDTRDDTFFPRAGRLVDLKVDVSSEDWGSDFGYERYRGDLALYSSVEENVVLAWHALAEYAGGDTPFFLLPSHRLRGYVSGRYRDRLWVGTEAELRVELTDRFGVAAFVGLGWVGEDLSDLPLSQALPSGGLGLRIRLSKETPIDYRIDVATGTDDEAIVYLSAGQAF